MFIIPRGVFHMRRADGVGQVRGGARVDRFHLRQYEFCENEDYVSIHLRVILIIVQHRSPRFGHALRAGTMTSCLPRQSTTRAVDIFDLTMP